MVKICRILADHFIKWSISKFQTFFIRAQSICGGQGYQKCNCQKGNCKKRAVHVSKIIYVAIPNSACHTNRCCDNVDI